MGELANKPRTTWVWTALVLQSALFAMALWFTVAFLEIWPRYASHASQLLPYMARGLAELVLVGISLIGLWRSKRWAWALALLMDGFICAVDLSGYVTSPFLLARYPRVLAFQAWHYAAFAVLLHQPVRRYFIDQSIIPKPAVEQGSKPSKEIGWPERPVRLTVFFVVGTAVTCALAAFSMTLLLGSKAGGARGFLFILRIAFAIGGISAFLFTLIMTLLVRKQNPARLWMWVLIGGLLAPFMIVGLGILAYSTRALGIPDYLFGYIYGGPVYLFQVWWLGIPIGIITAFACYQMYPWSFEERRI